MSLRGASSSTPSGITVRSSEDVERQIDKLRTAAKKAHEWIAQQSSDPIEFLRNVKFEKKGFHPITHHQLNLIEQVNQTWTYLVALEASKLLLQWHPEANGFALAPGATASQALDIMSIEPGVVGAETFAATHPGSNNKLKSDLDKLSKRTERARYIFFASPKFPVTARQGKFEKPGVAVWSIKV